MMEKEHAVSGSSMYLQEEQRAQLVTAGTHNSCSSRNLGRVNHGAIEKTKTSAGPECDQIMKKMLPIFAVVIVMAVVVPILAFAVYDVPHPIA